MKNKIKEVEVTILFILGSLILFWSCRENSTSNVILNPQIQKFSKFPNNSIGDVVHLKSAILSEPEFMIYYDSMLLFTFYYPKTDLIGAYLLGREEYKPIILTGRGPNEGISAAGIGINTNINELWFYDDIQKNISFVPFAKIFDNRQKITHKEQIPDDSYWNIEMLNDSLYLAFASMNYPEKKITIFNPYTHKVVNRVGEYYKTNGCPIKGVSEVFFASIKAKPGGDRFVCAYKKTDVIEIYNASGSLIHSVQGPDCFSANFKIDAITATHVKYHAIGVNLKAYNCLNTTSKYIYGLFNSRYIHVFDWNGNPIKRITLSSDLEEQISSFCVDNQNLQLYFYSKTYGRICKINLLLN